MGRKNSSFTKVQLLEAKTLTSEDNVVSVSKGRFSQSNNSIKDNIKEKKKKPEQKLKNISGYKQSLKKTLSNGESRLFCWYILLLSTIEMSGKGQTWNKSILFQYLLKRIFLCFMAKENCVIYISSRQRKGKHFFFKFLF